MSNRTESQSMSSTDPRHRSFHLTPTSNETAHVAPQEETANGWVRLIDSKGVPFAIRLDAITQIIGPYEMDSGFAVKLLTGKTTHEPIAFDDEKSAEVFVEDLLFED